MKARTRIWIAPLVLFLIVSMAAFGSARERIPAPEPQPSTRTSLDLDHVSAGSRLGGPQAGEILKVSRNVTPAKDGGVTVVVAEAEVIDASDLAVASNGDLYAVSCLENSSGPVVTVFRSTDAGVTWSAWGSLDDTFGFWRQPRLEVAEGTVNRCYLIAQHQVLPSRQLKIFTAWADLSASTADFTSTATEVMGVSGVEFARPQFLADDFVEEDFFMYVVAEGDEGTGTDIWFARSLDFGVTWETPYTIATINVADRHYLNPQISLSMGGRIHAAWNFDNGTTGLDDAIRARSAPSWGDGGSISWGTVLSLTSSSNGIEEYQPVIKASLTSDQVVITERRAVDEGSYLSLRSPGVFVSVDEGATFTETILSNGQADELGDIHDLVEDTAGGRWVFAGKAEGSRNPALIDAPLADPTNWSKRNELQLLPDEHFLQRMSIALDPEHADRVAAVWHLGVNVGGWLDHSETRFNAEWRGDPGWPVPLAGFPVSLYDAPRTDPCLADLDKDGDLEILVGFSFSQVGAWHHDGTPVDGWPVEAGGELSPAPLAVGDLTGDGNPLVIVCRADGDVRAFHPDGSQAWHRYGSGDQPAYASIGAFGGPEPRQVIVYQGQSMKWYDSTGQQPYLSGSVSWGYGGQAEAPPAIGDVDGDGKAEAVFHMTNHVFAKGMRGTDLYWVRTLPADVSGAPILVDMDDDGDQEIVVTTEDGWAYLLGGDGSNEPVPGWPIATPAGVALTGAVVGGCEPGSSYDFVFAGADNQLYVVRKDGSPVDGWPITLPVAMPLAPVLVPIDNDGADLIFPDLVGSMNALDHKGRGMPGWPQTITSGLALSPSLGDLDNDGMVDAVWLTEDAVHAFSLGQPLPKPDQFWPMAFFGSQRTSCSDCEENLVSGIREQDRITTVRFAAPFPNPVFERTVFSFVLSRESDVELMVYDLRGHRVASLVRARLEPGRHVEAWTGRNDSGQTLASGHYIARLRVGDEVLSQKITLVR